MTRGKAKRADYVLYIKPNIPLALVEAKDNGHAAGDGIQQALDYATTLNIPFVFSSNGDAFLFHDRTGAGGRDRDERQPNSQGGRVHTTLRTPVRVQSYTKPLSWIRKP